MRLQTLTLASTLATLVLAPATVFASGPGETSHEGTAYLEGGITYELFETSVSHVDLESCPAEFDPEAVFCRMTLASEQAHVWAFSHEGAQPLLAIKHYDLSDGFLPF